jgi:hypothetical protein
MADEHLKYLEFIQGAMTRMAANSFTIMVLSVLVCSLLFVLKTVLPATHHS